MPPGAAPLCRSVAIFLKKPVSWPEIMSSSRLLRLSSSKINPLLAVRSASTLAPAPPLPLPPVEAEFREKFLSRIGNRDIVGFGRNGAYSYVDCPTFPYPAIRWEQNTSESAAAMKKAEGDWKSLSLEEKKLLYRHSFCQTMSEMTAPTSEWKIVFGLVLVFFTISCWVYMFMRNNVFDAMLPSTITKEHHQAQHSRMLAQRQQIARGFSSKYDYEKEQWKK